MNQKDLCIFLHGKTNSCGAAIGLQEIIKLTSQTKDDKNGLILILDVKVDETNFVLVNIYNPYNPNTETEQVITLLGPDKLLETIKDLSDKHIVFMANLISFSIHPLIYMETNQL